MFIYLSDTDLNIKNIAVNQNLSLDGLYSWWGTKISKQIQADFKGFAIFIHNCQEALFKEGDIQEEAEIKLGCDAGKGQLEGVRFEAKK